jgi:hypothetical protein
MSPATKRQPRQIADTDPIPVEQGVETWRNGSAGIVVINRVGEYGRRISDSIHGGRVFQITPQERRMNQGACALPTQDPFTNGTLHPQTLLDSEPDTAFLRENPNVLNDEDLPKLFRLRGEEFSSRVNAITNVAAISRLHEMVRDPQFEATLVQYEIVKVRKMELDGDLDTGPPPDLDGGVDSLPRGVTPR